MDSAMEDSNLVALDRVNIDNLPTLLKWTSEILHKNAQEGAYACIIGRKGNGNDGISTTLLLGFPDLDSIDHVPPPVDVLYEYRKDYVEHLSPSVLSPWSNEEIRESALLQLSSVSLGKAGCVTEGGSFGGYIRSKSGKDSTTRAFGITAAHCLPECPIGTDITSPSSLELTSRLEHIIQYTRYSPNILHIRDARNKEAESLLTRYTYTTNPNGVEVLLSGDPMASRIILTGSKIGTFAGSRLTNQPGLLYKHNLDLASHGLQTFPEVTPEQSSRLDWAAFSVEAARYGGNVLAQEGDHITQTALLQPGDVVTKTGRTTATTRGRVNGIKVQIWRNGEETNEIAIVGTDIGRCFGSKGDSGAALLVERGGLLSAAGVLVGKNKMDEFVVATPLQAVLRDVGVVIGGTWEWDEV